MAFEWLTRWFWASEERAALVGEDSSHIDSTVMELDAYYATPGAANIYQTAAVEFALGMIGRVFMLAEPTPKLATLSPLTLSTLARQTIALGNSVWQITVDRSRGEPRLVPIADYEVAGGVMPESWRYQVERGLPSGERAKTNIPSEGVVHVRYLPRPTAPWHGVSPLVAAGLTSKQLAYIERSLGYEVQPPSGIILPLPDGITDRQKTRVNTSLSTGRGGINPIETTRGGFGQGETARPAGDWEQKRFGPVVPATNIDMREKTSLSVMSAAGIPPSLYSSQGSAQRESNRHFYAVTVEPLGALISDELSEKLEMDIVLDFPAAVRSDISARSRAFASLTQAGLTYEAAAKQAGLLPITQSDVRISDSSQSEPVA